MACRDRQPLRARKRHRIHKVLNTTDLNKLAASSAYLSGMKEIDYAANIGKNSIVV
jgi:hypothetical protein